MYISFAIQKHIRNNKGYILYNVDLITFIQKVFR